VESDLPLVIAAAILLAFGSLGAAASAVPSASSNEAGILVPAGMQLLMDPSQARPLQVADLSASDSGPPPSGPPIPTIQDGIGPGSALQQHATAGASAGFICTAAFLLRDPATATYYLSTAGHCVVRDETDPKPYTGAANPDKVNQEIDICVAQCLDNALGLGTYVSLVAKGSYRPVTYGESGGIGQDFGIIQLPPGAHDQLRPWMPQFGGPTGIDDSVSGDTLVHYGHGSYCCPETGAVASRTPADQGRVAVSLGGGSIFGGGSGTFSAIGSSTGGDSGSGVAIGVTDATRGLRGGSAVGVLTHGVAVEGVPYFAGTTLSHGLDMVRAATGLHLELVLENDPLNAPAQGVPQARVLIDTPAAGATVHPDADGTTTVQGIAQLGNGTLPDGSSVQLAIDDASFSPESRVPVLGNATWQASWDLHGVPLGTHILYARLLGPDGPMAATNHTVTVAARGTGGSSGGSGAPQGGSSGTGTKTVSTGGTATHRTGTKGSPGLEGTLAIASVAIAALLLAGRRRAP